MYKFLISLFLSLATYFAQPGGLSGIVKESGNNMPLAGVNILNDDGRYATTSNGQGRFFIRGIPAGTYDFKISHIGFELQVCKVTISENQVTDIEIYMKPVLLDLGEVKVISTLTESLIRDVPLPMEVKFNRDIAKTPAATVPDALKTEPGIALTRDGLWASSVNIRGLSKQNIITLIDGNRIETATNIAAGLSLIDINDIERIEVIKGAVSSIYGSGATGGIVNVITRKGAYNDRFNLSGSLLSSYSGVNSEAGTNLTLTAGNKSWFVKFAGSIRSADDVMTPAGIMENSQYRDNYISADFGFIPFQDHELTASFQRFDARDVGLPGGDPFPPDASARYPSELREMYSFKYSIRNLLPPLMNLSVKYFHQLIERRVELIPNPNAAVNTSADHVTDGLKLQTDWYITSNNRLSAGVDAWQREYLGSRTREIIPQNRIIGDKPVPDSRYRSIGIFAQDEWMLLDNELKLSLGARFDRINVSNQETRNPSYIISNGNVNNSPAPIDLASYPEAEVENNSWSINLGFLYSLSQNLDATFNIARSFRSPNLEERYQYIDLGGNIYLGNPYLESEKGNFFDLGFRFRSPFVSFKGNAFINILRDLVVDKEIIADSLYQKQNIGNALLYGFDMSLEYNFYEKMVLFTSAALVIGKDGDTDEYLPDIPPLNGRVGLRSRLFDLFDAELSAAIFAGQNKTAAGERTTPGYGVFDLYLSTIPINLYSADIQIYTGIENIFDKEYRNHLSTNRGSLLVEPGRNIFAKLRIGW